MKPNSPNIVDGFFFNVIDQSKIRIYNEKNIPFYDFKPTCDKIGRYLYDEGFVKTKQFKIEIQTS